MKRWCGSAARGGKSGRSMIRVVGVVEVLQMATAAIG